MPDGDKVHSELPGPYLEGYKHLCEGQEAEEVARKLEPALIKSVQLHGDLPVKLVIEIVTRVSRELPGPLFDDPVKRIELSEQVEELARKIPQKRARGIFLKTGKQIIYGHPQNHSTNVVSEACSQYVTNVLEDSCLSRIQNTSRHYLDVDHATVEEQLRVVKSKLVEQCLNLGEQIKRKESVNDLRLSRQPKPEEIEFDEPRLKSINLNEL